MRPLANELDRSLRRSRHRLRVLLSISSRGEAYIGQLARDTSLPWSRVLWVLVGRPPYYRRDLSLVGLGLVRERRGPTGRVFEVTSTGRRKARSVTRWLASRRPRDAFL